DPLTERLPLGDGVDDLQEGQGAGLDDVGADAAAAQHLALVFDLHERLALSVFAGRDAADAVVAQLDLDAGDALDAGEDGIDRAAAHHRLPDDGAVAPPQA